MILIRLKKIYCVFQKAVCTEVGFRKNIRSRISVFKFLAQWSMGVYQLIILWKMLLPQKSHELNFGNGLRYGTLYGWITENKLQKKYFCTSIWNEELQPNFKNGDKKFMLTKEHSLLNLCTSKETC